LNDVGEVRAARAARDGTRSPGVEPGVFVGGAIAVAHSTCAIARLRRALERGHPIAFRAHGDPDLESLRDHPACQEPIRPKD
jgi:hypothetical protein